MHSLFGPYWLLRQIGLGDLAEVFVAKRSDTDDERPAGRGLCAVKRISREMSQHEEVMALFVREGQLTAMFHHPKVVEVFDVGDVDGRPYICMEYIPGADLARLCDRIAPGRLPPGLALRIIRDVCQALDYVHNATDERGHPLDVVHGDITPTNILVSTLGVAKVIDFSVASSGLSAQGDRTVRGTYAYMSPEQVRGQPIDRRTDVFAVGVVLWELLTGARLFRRKANYLTLTAVVEEPATPLSSMGDLGLGAGAGELDRILTRALAKQRDERYPGIAELEAELAPLAATFGWDDSPWTLKTYVRELLS